MEGMHLMNRVLLIGTTATCLVFGLSRPCLTAATIDHDSDKKLLTIAQPHRDLVLRLNYDNRCVLDRVIVRGRDVVAAPTGVCSAVKVAGQWYTTRSGIAVPQVRVDGHTVTIAGVRFGGGGISVEEKWTFIAQPDHITWRIEREYLSEGTLDDASFPGWDFTDMATWTGALLGNGGVAWCRLFNTPVATYGLHTGPVTFWNKDKRSCLRIVPTVSAGLKIAARFSRHPTNTFSLNYSVTDEELATKYDLRRFLADKQDVWRPFKVTPGKVSAEYALSALDYDKEYDRGTFKAIDGTAVREILNTIGRIGAIDDKIMGSNGWYSGYAVLHEPWFAQMGLAIDDPYYTRAFANCLDWFRDHAITPEGRVRSRWAYGAYDAMPGSYDRFGFYECQWGWLMDSQSSWVINVAEQFDLSGDLEWLRRHKAACERALDYLLRRDSNDNGLVEMMADSHTAAKGSDWIDVIWAAFENAYVNAQLYYAMTLWADIEDLLGDSGHAARYRGCAGRLKDSFNKPVSKGGFWNPEKKWYVYWRDKDRSIHGDNLVVPVNFMAIGYGLCDDPARRSAILDHIEEAMQAENLFFWPLCIYSYRQDEGHKVNWPFPNYENGDIFLAWGELGTRAYASYDPAVALKYVRKVLDQYAKDGLAFQRYLRKTQRGEGDDILANNCSPVVGLYRNIYGIRPKHNRLYLEPHLTPGLNGTQLKYVLRGRRYVIDLNTGGSRVSANGFSIQNKGPFGLNVEGDKVDYFSGPRKSPSMVLTRPSGEPLDIKIESWSDTPLGCRSWSQAGKSAGLKIECIVAGLRPQAEYKLYRNGAEMGTLSSDRTGRLAFDHTTGTTTETFEISP
jgi:hypothetical protein